jgi:hypothetical protein
MYIMPKKYKSKNKFRPCVGNKLHPDKNLLKVGSNVRDLHAVAILHVHEPISSTLLQLKQAPSCQKKRGYTPEAFDCIWLIHGTWQRRMREKSVGTHIHLLVGSVYLRLQSNEHLPQINSKQP